MLRKIATYQFHLAVGSSIGLGVFAFFEPQLILVDDEGMYGPLRNNLLFAVGYLLIGQIGLWATRYQRGGYFEALIMGYTFFATAMGAKVYADVNGLPVSSGFIMTLIGFAIAHGVYYFFARPHGGQDSDPDQRD